MIGFFVILFFAISDNAKFTVTPIISSKSNYMRHGKMINNYEIAYLKEENNMRLS